MLKKTAEDRWYGAIVEKTPDGLSMWVTLPMETAPKGRIQNFTTVPTNDQELLEAAARFYLCRGAAQYANPDDQELWNNRLALATAELNSVESERDYEVLEKLMKSVSTDEEKATLYQRLEAVEDRKIMAMGRIARAMERKLYA